MPLRSATEPEHVGPDGSRPTELNAARHQAPRFIGERGLKTRSMLRKRAGRPRSEINSAGAGTTAASATLRATAAERSSPDRSAASATNADPDAIPPSQKYSGISQVHTGAFRNGPRRSAGIASPRIRRFAAATWPGWGSAAL